MDVRIGVEETPKEIQVDMGDDANADEIMKEIESRITSGDGVLWLTDKNGRKIGVPSPKIAYVEIGSPSADRRVGFGAS